MPVSHLGRLEPLESLGEIIPIGTLGFLSRDADHPTSHFLYPMLKHRPVYLGENILTNVDPSIGIDADDIQIICCVVDLAERQAIRDHWLTARVTIGQDVRRIQKS